MSHDIAIDKKSNQHMIMYAGEKPWHGLGQYVGENCVTWEEAVQQAHLNWEITKQQLYGPPATIDGRKMFRAIPAFGIFRKDTGQFISTVGKVYHPLQNKTIFMWADTLLGVSRGSHYEVAGALGVGNRVWALARVPKADFTIGKDDLHKMYLMLITSHDGSISTRAKLTDTRAVCNNTVQIALANEGQLLKIKHTKSAEAKLERAKTLMGYAVKNAKELAEKMSLLSKRALTRDSAETIFERLFPKPNDKEDDSTRRKNQIADILTLFERNDKNAIPEIRGTAYNLLNAVTEYTDHFRTARVTDKRAGYTPEQARAESGLFGSGSHLKTRALEIILEETQNASRPTKRKVIIPKPAESSILDMIVNEQMTKQ